MEPDDEYGSIYKMSAVDAVKTMLGIVMKMPVGKMVDAMSPIIPEDDKNLIKEELDFSMGKWGSNKMTKTMGEVVEDIDGILKDEELNKALGSLQTQGNKIMNEEDEEKRNLLMKQSGDVVGAVAEKLTARVAGAVDNIVTTMEEVLDEE
jgi:hypothetical protein